MFFLELSFFFLFLGFFLIIFFSEKISSLDITRLIFNLILVLLVFSFSLSNFGSISAVNNTSLLMNFSFFSFITGINFFVLDSFSLLLLILTAFLLSECALFLSEDDKYSHLLCICLLLIGLLLFLCFSVIDIVLFYIFFEALLIPMYLLIGLWGSRERKVRAIYLLFFYTLVSSLIFLIGIFYLYSIFNTSNFFLLPTLCYNYLTLNEQYCLWFFFFLSFASKIPIFPLHIWLPEAHVEAPTVGSVLLAGILLKIGVYGLIRFNIGIFSNISLFFSPFVYVLCVTGIIYSSLSAIRQTDIKRIIAYSSVAHMNMIVIGIFSFNIIAFEGAIFQSLSHGFVAGSLFFLIGFLYLRYHSRLVFYYGGLAQFMPIFASFFLFFTLANIAMPGTSSFVGEFLLLFGLFKVNIFVSILSVTSVILSGAYSLWLYNRVFFGNLKNNYLLKFSDLNFKETVILVIPFFLVLVFGIKPDWILNSCTFIAFEYLSLFL